LKNYQPKPLQGSFVASVRILHKAAVTAFAFVCANQSYGHFIIIILRLHSLLVGRTAKAGGSNIAKGIIRTAFGQ